MVCVCVCVCVCFVELWPPSYGLQVLVVLWVVSPLYRIVLLLLSLLNCLLSWKVKRVKEEGVGAEVVPSSSPCSSSLDLPFIRAADDSFSGARFPYLHVLTRCVMPSTWYMCV